MRPFNSGGLDLGPPNTLCTTKIITAPVPSVVLKSDDLESAIPSFMTKDWIVSMSNKVQAEIDAVAVAKAVHAVNVSDSLRPVDRDRALRALRRQLKAWVDSLPPERNYSRTRRNFQEDLERDPGYGTVLIRDIDGLRLAPLSKKDGFSHRSSIDTMLAAIAASPYRDVATAQLALHVGVVDAAIAAMSLGKNRNLAEAALGRLQLLRLSLGEEVCVRIIQSIRSVGPSYESVLHPVLLSWVCKQATEYAIITAIDRATVSVHEWDYILDCWMRACVSAVVADGLFPMLSHY
jgi:hypothetical protein